MYLIISVGLILLTAFFTYWKRIDKFRKANPELFNFGLTLVATFVGVFLAIDLTNKAERKKEEKNVIKLLNATSVDLRNCKERTNVTYSLATLGADSIYSTGKHIENNPIQYPKLFQSIVSNEVVLRHLSQQGIEVYNQCADNLLSLQNAINTGKAKNDTILIRTVGVYIKELEYAQKILLLEIGRLEGSVSDKYLDEHYSNFNYEKIGIGPHDIESAIKEQREREKENK